MAFKTQTEAYGESMCVVSTKEFARKVLSRKGLTVHHARIASKCLPFSDSYDQLTFPCKHHDEQ